MPLFRKSQHDFLFLTCWRSKEQERKGYFTWPQENLRILILRITNLCNGLDSFIHTVINNGLATLSEKNTSIGS